MADSFSGNLNLTLPEVGFANNTWGGTAGLNRDLSILDSLFQSNGLSTAGPIVGSGHPNAGVPGVGLRVGVGYTLNVEGFALFKDHTDVTKVATLDSSLITTATTRTYKFPDASGTFALKDTSCPTGTILSGYYGAVAPPGFVLAAGKTIGNAGSLATERANADCLVLFTLLWAVTADAQCPVSGGRGANAAADWAANKTLTLPDHSGRAMAGRDDLSGVNRGILGPGFVGTSTLRGSVGGQATFPSVVSVSGGTPLHVVTDLNSNVQPTIVVDVVIAL